jgi:hypothetical protein
MEAKKRYYKSLEEIKSYTASGFPEVFSKFLGLECFVIEEHNRRDGD